MDRVRMKGGGGRMGKGIKDEGRDDGGRKQEVEAALAAHRALIRTGEHGLSPARAGRGRAEVRKCLHSVPMS
jgi:hypothetical protein